MLGKTCLILLCFQTWSVKLHNNGCEKGPQPTEKMLVHVVRKQELKPEAYRNHCKATEF